MAGLQRWLCKSSSTNNKPETERCAYSNENIEQGAEHDPTCQKWSHLLPITTTLSIIAEVTPCITCNH